MRSPLPKGEPRPWQLEGKGGAWAGRGSWTLPEAARRTDVGSAVFGERLQQRARERSRALRRRRGPDRRRVWGRGSGVFRRASEWSGLRGGSRGQGQGVPRG